MPTKNKQKNTSEPPPCNVVFYNFDLPWLDRPFRTTSPMKTPKEWGISKHLALYSWTKSHIREKWWCEVVVEPFSEQGSPEFLSFLESWVKVSSTMKTTKHPTSNIVGGLQANPPMPSAMIKIHQSALDTATQGSWCHKSSQILWVCTSFLKSLA